MTKYSLDAMVLYIKKPDLCKKSDENMEKIHIKGRQTHFKIGKNLIK